MEEFVKKLLTRLQRGLPLSKRPFQQIADELRSSEDDIVMIILDLVEKGSIREISPIFESEGMGYESTLAGAKVDKGKLDSVAEFISTHPGVTHNYERDNELNLWFTLTVPQDGSIDRTIEVFSKLEGVDELLDLRREKTYKIRVAFNLSDEEKKETYRRKEKITKPDMPEDVFKLMVEVLQKKFPLCKDPYEIMAKKARMGIDDFIGNLRKIHESGVLRRLPAMVRHRKVGIKHNAMITWKVNEGVIDDVGNRFADFDFVTHCYKRKVYPQWSYNLYTMTHAKDENTWNNYYKMMKEACGTSQNLVLRSLKEYKKSRIKYFDPMLEEWNGKNL